MTRLCAYFGNPWIGIFIKTNDSFTAIPLDSTEGLANSVRERLGTEVVRMTVAESSFIGTYLAMNSAGAVLPNMIRPHEAELLKGRGLAVYSSMDSLNAHGHNIAVNDKGGIINMHVPQEERKRMEEALGVELVPMSIAGYTTVGSMCLASNRGFLAHYGATDDEMEAISSALHVKGNKGSVNTGTGFVSIGAVANNRGYIAGDRTTAHEMGRMEEALDLVASPAV